MVEISCNNCNYERGLYECNNGSKTGRRNARAFEVAGKNKATLPALTNAGSY